MQRPLIVSLSLTLAACASVPAVESSRIETAITSATSLDWSTSPAHTPVRIEASHDPMARPGRGVVLAQSAIDGRVALRNEPKRTYYTVTARSGDFERTALRVLPLQGGRNFRDLGGYRTADGRSLKWGQVFRSGALSSLTDVDYAFINDLGIKTVIDFRSNGERLNEPTRWRAARVETVTTDYVQGGDGDAFAKALRAPGATPDSIASVMMVFYRNVPDQFADQYAAMFHRLAKGDGALLFHCSAGKDRTGVAASVLLTMLGVPHETVLADYALSEQVVDYMAQMQSAPANPKDPYAFLRRLPPEMVRPLMRSDPRYLDAALEEINKRYGSVDAYVRTKLGVSDAEMSAIRQRLLEATP